MAKETIQFTSDYDRFVFGEDNRDTERSHIRELKGSMQRNGFIKSKAISVRAIPGSRKLLIVDGQHRFIAAKELGINVWFKIDDTITDEALPDMQIAKKWLPKDYLKHFVAKGVPNYLTLIELHTMYPNISISPIVLLLVGGINEDKYMDNFRHGNIKITHLKEARRTLELAKELHDLYKHEWLTGRTFLAAFIQILAIPDYDHKMMLHKLKSRSNDFMQQLSEEAYFKMFDKIYNHNARSNRIVFTYVPRPKSKAGRPTKDK